MKTIEELDHRLSEPSEALISDMNRLTGDIMILGAAGKMGPSLALLARRAVEASGSGKKIIGVSRYSEPGTREMLDKAGIETHAADLLNDDELNALPDAENIIYMVGYKFGSSKNAGLTWAINSYLPGRVAIRFRNSSLVIFSSGNVYPFVPVQSGGATEDTPPQPIGEYAQSCLGRERVFEYFTTKNKTPALIYRLNYAIDLRYGVLLDIARSVYNEQTVDLTTGHVNVIWQGDANEYALRSLLRCTSPPAILNITGPETLSVRWLAEQFGEIFSKKPLFVNHEMPDALLNNASASHRYFGYPRVTIREMIEWTADWVANDGEVLDKPTHFQQRKGKF